MIPVQEGQIAIKIRGIDLEEKLWQRDGCVL